MGRFLDSIRDELDALDSGFERDHFAHPHQATFGDYDSNAAVLRQVQTAINALGYQPALTVDGAYGPLTQAAIKWAQAQKGLPQDGVIGDPLLAALAITPAPAPPAVKISTVVAALRQAAKEQGYTLSDQLLSLMIGQLRGAEGAYPGVNSSLGGTNNYGAAQVTASLASAKQGLQGWGAFAHKDSDPNKGPYIGWYWIAPSPLEGARHWFQDNWWGKALATGNPTNATDYAAILYKGGYYGGTHPGDTAHDPTSDAGQLNVADYAAAIQRGVATAAEMAQPPDDPATTTVNPSQFAPLTSRAITEDLYNTAMSGGLGSAWKFLLPATWDALVANNGAVWFGPPPAVAAVAVPLLASIATPAAIVASVKANPARTVGIVAAVAAVVGGIVAVVTRRKPPAPPT